MGNPGLDLQWHEGEAGWGERVATCDLGVLQASVHQLAGVVTWSVAEGERQLTRGVEDDLAAAQHAAEAALRRLGSARPK